MKTSTLSKCGWSASELNIDVWLIRSYIKRNHQFLSSCSCIVAITQLSAGLKWAKAVLRLGSECNWWLSSTFEWMGKSQTCFCIHVSIQWPNPLKVLLYLSIVSTCAILLSSLDFYLLHLCYSALPNIHHLKTHSSHSLVLFINFSI